MSYHFLLFPVRTRACVARERIVWWVFLFSFCLSLHRSIHHEMQVAFDDGRHNYRNRSANTLLVWERTRDTGSASSLPPEEETTFISFLSKTTHIHSSSTEPVNPFQVRIFSRTAISSRKYMFEKSCFSVGCI